MRRRQVLASWNRLKPKLTNLAYLKQHKALIKEAVEFHSLQASSFTFGPTYAPDETKNWEWKNNAGVPRVAKETLDV